MDMETVTTVCAAIGLTTLVEISPIKINPWSCIWNMLKMLWSGFCRALNADVLNKLSEIETRQIETREKLDSHIKMDDCREADKVRSSILQFNNELLRDIPHTKEEYIEVLSKIDWYNEFCQINKDYKNSRAVHAIANILRAYDDRLQKHDFL